MTGETRQRGFTLVEIAVVLVVVGILIGSFIQNFADRIETTRINETSSELEEIKQIIMAFAYTNGGLPRLPCPDTDVPPDGLENPAGGPCAANEGALPWQDLGAGREDAWGTHYRYWVASNYSDAGFDLTTSNTAGVADIDTRVNDVIEDLGLAAFVVMSHGKNSFGGTSVQGALRPAVPVAGYDDENENTNGDDVFVSREKTEIGAAAAGGVYDDIVMWVSPFEVKAYMLRAGVLPP